MVADESHQEQISQYCSSQHPTYDHRVYIEESYNWCVVPDTGQDAILFASVAVTAACLAQGRFSNSIVLLAGAAVQGFMLPYNLGRFGNGISIWLGIQPYELFFYIFLPPLLLDAAVRIDFFLFKKVVVQVITLAFLVVGASVGVMIPIMLYVLDLHSSGWTWQYVALFISMLASTDAVAIIATMKTSGGPKRLRVLLEGEALLNDASSFTLFEIFLHLVEQLNTSGYSEDNGWVVFGDVVKLALKLGFGGLGIGLAFGIVCRYVLRFMRYMGATIDQQVSLTVAFAYLSYYTANSPARVSGVVSVAVYGLYGAATSKWDMSAKVEESGAFDAFWDTLSFVVNGLVFFFSGAACINFFVRSSQSLESSNHGAVLASTIWRLPLIYIFMFIVRFVLTALFRPMFRIFLGDLTWRELLFATAAGLRGSVSLILAQAVVTDEAAGPSGDSAVIKAEIVLWTAGFVLMTLMINAPLLPLILRKTGLSSVSDGKQRMRRRTVKALCSHSDAAIENLKNDEDEMLRGVDWEAVQKFICVDNIYGHFTDPSLPPNTGQKSLLKWPGLARPKRSQLPRKGSLVEANGTLNTEGFFGRAKGSWAPGDDSSLPDVDEFPLEDVPETADADPDADSDNEELNEWTAASGNEFPFLGRQEEQPRSMQRSKTFASFNRRSLLPITRDDTEPGTLAAGPAGLNRGFQSTHNLETPSPPPPTAEDLERSKTTQAAVDSLPRAASLGRAASGASSKEGSTPRGKFPLQQKTAYIMTSAGLLMAPLTTGESRAAEAPRPGDNQLPDSPPPGPKLRISGDELRKLVTEGTSGKTWPKMRSDAAKRPPLPFKTPQRPTTYDAPARSKTMETNEASTTTWSGSPYNTVTSSTNTWRRSTGPGQKARPSVFDAFDIERPGTRAAHSAVAKHKTIFDAFGVTDQRGSSGSLNRLDSTYSAGSSAKAGGSPLTSPQSTWTAGMTKGVPPKELVAELKRNRSAPDLEDSDELEATESSTPSQMRGLPKAISDRASLKAPPMGHLSESELIEARVRLIVGLKRYFHGKRIEGLLSSAALRILDNACDNCLEDPTSFNLWESLEKDATGTFLVGIIAHQTFFWRKVVLMLRRRRSDSYRFFLYSRQALAWPLRKAIGIGHHLLTRYMLTGIEVAIEYMLGLTYSPQVQLLKRHETARELLEEIQSELDKVWKFILDREVEAPERFQAIQTYRATTAVLKQQLAFVKTMYESGIVDDLERDELLRPIDKRERHLERKGPQYRNPTVIQVLNNLPFLRQAPGHIVEILYRHGRLQMHRSGTDFAIRQTRSLFIVTSGLIKVSYTDPQGHLQEYFLASGGMLGLYTAVTGHTLPGEIHAIAEGNALGKGPVVFELFQSGIKLLKKHAAAGKPVFQQIELDMHRLSALYVVERLKPRLMPFLLVLLSQQQQRAAKQQQPPASEPKPPKTPFAGAGSQGLEQRGQDLETISLSLTADTVGTQAEVRDAVLEQYTKLLHDLASSEVVELPAGIPYTQRSSAVLLKGTIKVSGKRAGDLKRGSLGTDTVVEYHAPFVFPYIAPSAGQSTPPLRLVAGYKSSEQSGALLMVCPSDRYEEEPPRSASMEPELARRSAIDSKDATSSTPPPPPAAPPRQLTRVQSKALILNVNDTGEHVAAQRSDGTKSEWWENALSRPSMALRRMSHLPGMKHDVSETVQE